MRITIFTSSALRHLNLINMLSSIAHTTYAIIESKSVVPQFDLNIESNEALQIYMKFMNNAEQELFSTSKFITPGTKTLFVRNKNINSLRVEDLGNALKSEIFVVFGSSFIKGWLVDFLVKKGAINLHMGISPYYRGSACNFWSLYDNKPNFVGATVHYLSRGLDDGPVIFHSTPDLIHEDPFAFTMKAVKQAQIDLINYLMSKSYPVYPGISQDKKLELRYSRISEFDNEVASEFLTRDLRNHDLKNLIRTTSKPNLVRILS